MEIVYKMIWTSLRRVNLKRETGSLLSIVQNKAIRTNYAKTNKLIIRGRIEIVSYEVAEGTG